MEQTPYDKDSSETARVRTQAFATAIIEPTQTTAYERLRTDENAPVNPLDDKKFVDSMNFVTVCFGGGLFFLFYGLFTTEGQCNMRTCHGQDVVKPWQMNITDSTHGFCCQDDSNDCSISQMIPCVTSAIRAILPNIGSYCDFTYQATTTNDTLLAIQRMLADDDFRLLKDHKKPLCFNDFEQTYTYNTFGFHILIAWVVIFGVLFVMCVVHVERSKQQRREAAVVSATAVDVV